MTTRLFLKPAKSSVDAIVRAFTVPEMIGPAQKARVIEWG